MFKTCHSEHLQNCHSERSEESWPWQGFLLPAVVEMTVEKRVVEMTEEKAAVEMAGEDVIATPLGG